MYSHLKAVRITHMHDKSEAYIPLHSTEFGNKNTHKLIFKVYLQIMTIIKLSQRLGI